MVPNGPRMTQNDPNGLKNDRKWPKITPKWPKSDARIYALFQQFFLSEKAVLQTFSLLECMFVAENPKFSTGHSSLKEIRFCLILLSVVNFQSRSDLSVSKGRYALG